jgi:type VII secretion effector (TIGR04197 family)
MSIAGKVLVFVIIVALVAWIWLFAKVYALNTGWGEAVQRLEKQVEDLGQQIATRQAELDTVLAAVAREKLQRDDERVVLEARLSEVEALEANRREEAERVRLQLALLEEATRDAQTTVAGRTKEREDTEQAKAQAEALVKNLQTEVEARMEELASLREEFLRTTEENRQLLRRLRSRNGSSDEARTGRTRPASFAR